MTVKRNLVRGLLRLWLVAGVAWVAAVVFLLRADDVRYAWRYTVQPATAAAMAEESARTAALSRPPTEAEADCERAIAQARAPGAVNEYDELLAKQKCRTVEAPGAPRSPDWTWLWLALLPPTFGVAALGLLALVTWRLGNWVRRGFEPR